MEENKGKKKKIIIAMSAIALLALCIAGAFLLRKENSSTITSYPVDSLGEGFYTGDESTMSGTIVDQFSQNVIQRSDLSLKRIHVKRGQKVKKGTVLVTYDCRRDELEMKLKEIEVQKRERDIENREKALATLKSTGKDTYEDNSNLPGSEDDEDEDSVDEDTDASAPSMLTAWINDLRWLNNPFNSIVEATGTDGQDQAPEATTTEKAAEKTTTEKTPEETTTEKAPEEATTEAAKTEIPEGVTAMSLVKALLGDSADKSCTYGNGTVLEVYIVKDDNNDSYDVKGQAVLDAIDIAASGKEYTSVVFKRFTKEQVEKGGGPEYQLNIPSGTFLSPGIDKSATYSLEDIYEDRWNQAIGDDKDDCNMEITPSSNKVSKGSSYTYKLKVDDKETSTDLVWSISGNKSKKTTIDSKTGKLTVASDEKAKKIKITATINGESVSKTVKVKDASSSTTSTSSSTDTTSSDTDSSDIDSESVVYKGDELREQIAQREEELEDEKIDLAEAKIKYKELKQKVEAATIRASMNGQITVAYTRNNLPESGQPIVVLRSRGGTYVQFDVNEMNLDIVKVDGKLTCTKGDSWDSFDESEGGSKKYVAQVTNIADYPSSNKQSSDEWLSDSGTSNPDSSSYTVTATITDSDGLTSGDIMNVSFDNKSMNIEDEEDTVVIMAPFIRQDGRRYYVYKVGKNNRLKKQYVQIGKSSYGYTQVLSGLKAGDYIAFPYNKEELDNARTKKEDDTSKIVETLMEAPEFAW